MPLRRPPVSPRSLLMALALGCLASQTLFAAEKPSAEGVEFFEKRVRPILAENCHKCHGAEKQESGLRLDLKAHALRGGDGGAVIVAGKPDESPLVSAINYDGYEMPPDGKLPDAQIVAITKWIAMGAPWPDDGSKVSALDDPTSPASIAKARREHWAFQPVVEPPVPDVGDSAWVKSPIDHFVLAKLKEAGMKPSPPADKRTLLRRATYDLIGLPPTMEELRAFEADDSPDAFARVVDRLLASPAYGERWARHWLDVARYGDSAGYLPGNVVTRYPYAYTYRDYVIRSFNEDLPYDQFIREQIAADLLPTQRDPKALAALGFLTVGPRFINSKHDIVDDRIDVVTRGLMALTVTCARCHNHKYDPIPTADYYSLAGIFFSSEIPNELPLIEQPDDSPEYLAFKKELDKRQQAVDDYLDAQRVEVLKKIRGQSADFLLAALAETRPQAQTDEIKARVKAAKLDRRFTRRWVRHLRAAEKRHDAVFAPWRALIKLPADKFAAQVPAALAKLWKTADAQPDEREINPLVREALEAQPPKSLIELADTYGRLLKEVDQVWREKQKSAPEGQEVQLDAPQSELLALLYGDRAPADMSRGEIERSFSVPVLQHLRGLRRKVDGWRVNSPNAPERAMVLNDRSNPHDIRVLVRGKPGRQGDIAPRHFLAVLSEGEREHYDQGSGRLQLAEAIASADNPLTPRVIVNRVWMRHFGKALVRTPGNFGKLGEEPTHPQLLDWLTARFMAEGWSLKKLHRTIMLSAVYQQQSTIRPDCLATDPENRLLWRMNRRRLAFEPMRDTLLAVAGRLDRTVGGQPFEFDKRPFSTRRTIYGLIDREFLDTTLPTFDFPSPDVLAARRPQTIVPQQALYLMNSPFVVEQAKHFAARPELTALEDPAERVQAMYRLALQRDPAADELERSLAFVKSQQANEKSEAQKIGPWEMLAQVLLLTDEVMYLD